MIINRRNFLGLMAAGAIGALCSAREEHKKSKRVDADYACILLHGMFFMTFKDSQLIVTTPRFRDHIFGIRGQDDSTIIPLLPILGSRDLYWTQIGLKDGGMQQFPKTLLSFSAGDTGVGELLPLGNAGYEFSLILPLPANIYPFRADTLGTFTKVARIPISPKPSRKESVRSNIIRSCGSNDSQPIGLLTGLIYERSSGCLVPNVLSFHAEHPGHCPDIGATQVNAALDASQALFQTGTEFDLKFQDFPTVPICPPKSDQYGVHSIDELSACELTDRGCTRGPNPINCAQFGVNG
ncbi:MAG TPA: hypothetical protein VFW31_12495 [Candidatus Angelobacter sp.]|nr:hypothetical protein [Candidatus Angelobacter sp.]